MSVAPDLVTLQRWFAHVITHPGSVEEGVRSSQTTGGGVTEPAQATRIVRPNARMTALQRIGVYHYAYRARLTECIAEDYPALRYALGASAFEVLCREYIERFPPKGPTLEAYAQHLAALCAERGNAFAEDLARLEWAVVSVIHAPDPAPLTLAALATLDPREFARCKLIAKPSLQLLALRYPVNAFYHAFHHEDVPAIPVAEPVSVLVQRQGSTVYRRELSPVAAKLLQSLLDGMPIAAALAAEGGDDPKAVSAWFREWVGAGLFTGLAGAD